MELDIKEMQNIQEGPLKVTTARHSETFKTIFPLTRHKYTINHERHNKNQTMTGVRVSLTCICCFHIWVSTPLKPRCLDSYSIILCDKTEEWRKVKYYITKPKGSMAMVHTVHTSTCSSISRKIGNYSPLSCKVIANSVRSTNWIKYMHTKSVSMDKQFHIMISLKGKRFLGVW